MACPRCSVRVQKCFVAFFVVLMAWVRRDGTLASMKVLVGDLTDDRTGIDELGMLKTVHSRNPLSSGYPHICHLLDNFVHHGPNGDHRCLILEAMPFNMLEIHNAFRSASDAMPLFVIQRVAQQVLLALQYIHEECGLVHTGKPSGQCSAIVILPALYCRPQR